MYMYDVIYVCVCVYVYIVPCVYVLYLEGKNMVIPSLL